MTLGYALFMWTRIETKAENLAWQIFFKWALWNRLTLIASFVFSNPGFPKKARICSASFVVHPPGPWSSFWSKDSESLPSLKTSTPDSTQTCFFYAVRWEKKQLVDLSVKYTWSSCDLMMVSNQINCYQENNKVGCCQFLFPTDITLYCVVSTTKLVVAGLFLLSSGRCDTNRYQGAID